MNRIVLLVALLWPGLSVAVDGVLEINQATVEAAGGFPYQISQPGSYVLTSSLRGVPGTTVLEIAVSASPATIDLNGFEIIGAAADCIGSGAGLSCAADAGAHGISAGATEFVTVRNGMVRNMQGSGVVLGAMGRVQDVSVKFNSGNGIAGAPQTLIRNCIALWNGENGINASRGAVVEGSAAAGNLNFGINAGGDATVQSSTVRGNGSIGLNRNGRLSETGNACDDGSCSPRGERRFYLTPTRFNGAESSNPGNCAAGFHFALYTELFDVSSLHYDTQLGDSAWLEGPDASGWIRTGGPALVDNGSNGEYPNCNGWTSNDINHRGASLTRLLRAADPGGAVAIGPWTVFAERCHETTFKPRLWCVED